MWLVRRGWWEWREYWECEGPDEVELGPRAWWLLWDMAGMSVMTESRMEWSSSAHTHTHTLITYST